MTLVWVPQVLCLTLAFLLFLKEQLKLNNLANSSHSTTGFSFWASLSGHQALDRIQGVSGIEHNVRGKKILPRSPRALVPLTGN